MDWILASVGSAVFLGVYDLSKKHSVSGNAVLPVLFLSTLLMALCWMPMMLTSGIAPGMLPESLAVDSLSIWQHLQLMLKSLIVGGSWICSYFALKHLPVSIGAPIRATGPVWTILGALLILGERPAAMQGLGMTITLAGFIGLSVAGRREGLSFHRDKWIGFMLMGTMLGAVSSLYDKYLLGTLGFNVATVQSWFSAYLAILFLPLMVGWYRRWWPRGEFTWRWSIPLIAIFLLIADYAYFWALRDPDALISLVACIRRGSVFIAFVGGFLLFRESVSWFKFFCICGIVTGICVIVF